MPEKHLLMKLLPVALLLMSCGDDDSPPAGNDGRSTGGDTGAPVDQRAADSSSRDLGAQDRALDQGINDATVAPDADAGPPPPDTNPVPAVPVLPHKTDFLNVGCRTHTYGGLSSAARSNCRAAMKQRGYTHFYLYVYNENDYGGPSFDYFADAAGFNGLLQELIDDGLAPVVWFFPDDAPTIRTTPRADLEAKLTALVPQIDHLVSSYCLGLELDEYWGPAKVDPLGQHLRTLTQKKIAVHQINGKWSYGAYPWVDYMILQYGFEKSAAFIRNMTQQCIAELQKPVVAGEYALDDEGTGVILGNAAVAAGAEGFGNGGTP